MNSPVSPAIALLQQLETLLRDPLLGPRVAQQVAAAMADVVNARRDDAPCGPDAEAYARLWIPAWDVDSARQQALISLASI
ncbi:hypothetical protein [Herbaspirillum rhizosphaerae]|uniref:hypothetical protein n=1 Tax=Herbaspirillum rhizosphaerae TaxID=346179 RepID=UPI00067DAFAC|nr:hypothetical protein [Herbaspirillum rhizosphaerae]